MATTLSSYANTVLAGGRSPILADFVLATTNGLKAGYACYRSAAGAVKALSGSVDDASDLLGPFVGICLEQAGTLLDTGFTDADPVRVILAASKGTKVRIAIIATQGALVPGDLLVPSTTAGQWMKKVTSATPTVEENAIASRNAMLEVAEEVADVGAVQWVECYII